MPTASTNAEPAGKRGTKRLRALSERATKRRIDWESRLRELPDDERLRAAALAALLQIDAVAALKPEADLDRLEEEAERLRSAAEESDREFREHLQREGLGDTGP
jgi:hypothetical protein